MTTRGNINGVHSTHQPPHHQPHHNHNHHQPQPQPQPHHNHNHNHHQPQSQPQPYPYHQHRSSSSAASFKGCCCCLFLLLTFLVLLFIAVTLFVFLALKPKKPHFDLQQVSVHYLILTSSSDAAAYLSLNISMVFTAENPNKVGIKYSGSDFYVMYKGVPLGVARVPPFYQAAHSVRTVETRVGVDRVDVSMVNAADLVKDATVNDRVELMVVGEIGARIRVMDINSPKVKVSVACAIVISPRKQSLTYKQCGVEGLSV